MTSTDREPKRPGGGYRGTLPARDDRLARPWLIVVAVILVGIFVLAFLGVPSRLTPEPTPVPVPTLPGTPDATDGADPTDQGPSPTG